MRIRVTEGVGTGPTELSAFDQALVRGGIANYNLIYLSSVLPPGSDVSFSTRPKEPEGRWGDRLYVVMAQNRTSLRNQEVWAGIGWVQAADGRGLFVRHTDPSQENVVDMIQTSLGDMTAARKEKFGPTRFILQSAKFQEHPACCLVAAVFRSEGWRNGGAESPLSH